MQCHTIRSIAKRLELIAGSQKKLYLGYAANLVSISSWIAFFLKVVKLLLRLNA